MVLEKFGLRGSVPERVRALLEKGTAGLEGETVKPGDPRLARSEHLVIGNNRLALDGALEKAEALGFSVELAPSAIDGEAQAAGRTLAEAARKAQAGLASGKKRCLLSGGETTVRVLGKGRGGRNQELALAFALAIAGMQGIELLSAGTDGTDGPTDATGAIVDGRTIECAVRLGLDAAAFLADNDSYSFFSELDRRGGGRHHLKTGPTGTNVMDLQLILIERSER
jgi:glycerate-2-kinase